MASGEDSTPLHPAAEALMDRLVQQIEDMRKEAADEPTCVRNPHANASPDDNTLGALENLKIQLESELEAVMATPFVQVPDDPGLLMGLATEDMQRTAHWNARTLEFYKKKNEELQEKKRKYETMIKKATSVSQALDNLQSQCFSNEDKRVALERRHNRMTVLFRFLRAELHYILGNFYAEEMSTPESVKSMEDLLDSLVTKMLAEPNDPYVVIDNTMEQPHITLLLSANLITRHPTDITRIRFIDPRP